MTDGKDKTVDLCLIDNIRIGERYRQDLGNLDELIKSIQAVGLLHPVVVTPDGQLIAGHLEPHAHPLLVPDSCACPRASYERRTR